MDPADLIFGGGTSRCFHAYQRVRYNWSTSSPFVSFWERQCSWRVLLTCVQMFYRHEIACNFDAIGQVENLWDIKNEFDKNGSIKTNIVGC